MDGISEDEIRALLSEKLADVQLEMVVEGNKLSLTAVSPSFEGLNRVKRQQLVYSLLNDKIASGEIHAVTMKTVTPQEAGN